MPNDTPPFLTSQGPGKPRNFVENASSAQAPHGGRDFTRESRSQSEATPEVVPNPQEIPAGGKILMAEPGGANVTGDTSNTPTATPRPFKSLR